jgi:hypothetical protein
VSVPGPALPPMQGESGAPFVAGQTEIIPPDIEAAPAVPEPELAAVALPAGLTLVHDATHTNIAHLPPGQAAGYATGTPDIQWTQADWDSHAGAVRIDQDARASDGTADVLDVENGAATPAESPAWAKTAATSYLTAKRKGERAPLIYASADNITAVTNALIAGGISSGIGLWVANYNLTQTEAVAMVANASGPFPIKAVQFTDNLQAGRLYDTSVFSAEWLAQTADKSQWLRLVDIPHNAPVYYNEKKATLGYTNTAGKWVTVALP